MPMTTIPRAAVLLFVSVLSSACSKQVKVKDIYSPDKSAFLRVEIDESGGAAVSDVTSVYLLGVMPFVTKRKLVFRGSAMSRFKANWASKNVIQLSYADGYVTRCKRSRTLSTKEEIAVIGCK